MSTSFIGANNFIPLSKAKQLTAFFKGQKGQLINPHLHAKDVIPYSETFDRVAIDELLGLPGCVGIRIYFGLDEEFKIRLILVGVNDKGEDLIIPSSTEDETSDGKVVEEGIRCPPHCPTTSSVDL